LYSVEFPVTNLVEISSLVSVVKRADVEMTRPPHHTFILWSAQNIHEDRITYLYASTHVAM